MKTRTGFVSNSSSSSFIVSFDRDPTDLEALTEMMGDCSVDIYGIKIPAEKVIETVYNDIMSGENKVTSPIMPKEDERWDNGRWDMAMDLCVMAPDCRDATDEEVDMAIKLRDEYRLKLWCMMNKTTPEEWAAKNQHLYTFTYCDENGGFWSGMEHGNVFRNVNVVDFQSHH